MVHHLFYVSKRGNAMNKRPPARNIFVGMILLSLCCTVLAFSAEDKMACGEEIEKYCSHVQPGQLSLTACLDAKRDQLSVACREKVDKSLAKIAQAKKICETDIQKFCAEVKPGEGRILDCMVAKKEQLTPECRQQIDKYTAARGAAPQNRAKGQ